MSYYKSNPGVYVIAEVGINHNGDLEHAKELIRLAFTAGADGVKIQVRDLESVYTQSVLDDPLIAEQGTQYILKELRKVTFSFDQIRELFTYAKQFDGDFFGSPFDLKSADFLQELEAPLFKIGSPDFTNLPLIKHVVSFGKPIILSTGMCNEEELLQVVAFLKEEGADFALLHCNSTYPASYQDLNLRYVPRLAEIAGVETGYSGHERDYAPTLAAVALGASIIERHITDDPTQEGADQSSSLSDKDFGDMVVGIRNVEKSLGKPIRNFNQGEQNNRVTLGKSLVAAQDITKGTILTDKHIVSKSPAKGVSPLLLDKFLGHPISRDLRKDDLLLLEDVQLGTECPTQKFDIPNTWGIVGRLNDFEEFLDIRPDLVEIHLTWRDINNYENTKFMRAQYNQDLVVHAPEYYNDKLIDFTTDNSKVNEYSTEMLQRTINLARSLGSKFRGQTNPEGPRVILHPGGHFESLTSSNKHEQYGRLLKNLRAVDTEGVRVLVENMPPFPWYFGGQWHNTIFMDPQEIADFASEMGWGICYDLSHAQLYCNHAGIKLENFTKDVLKHVEYLHVSDAAGTTQEGLQLGKGNLEFDHLFAILNKVDVGFIPEIWNGHLQRGAGMKEALRTIETLLKTKTAGKSHEGHHENH